MRQAFGDTVEVRLATDQSDIGMLLGLPDQMFAGAEADLQPDLPDRPEQGRRIGIERIEKEPVRWRIRPVVRRIGGEKTMRRAERDCVRAS